MRRDRKLTDRNRDRDENLARRAGLFQRTLERRRVADEVRLRESVSMPLSTDKVEEPAETSVVPPALRSLTLPRLLNFSAADAPVAMQPWTVELAHTLLARAADKKLSLRLIWPAEIEELVTLHAMARLMVAFEHDFKGIKTLFYPGSNASRIALDKLASDRSQLVTLRQEMWNDGAPVNSARAPRKSAAFEALLTACNDVSCFSPEQRPPQLRDLIPTFIFNPKTSSWDSPLFSPLERLIRKVAKQARRKDMREQIGDDWRDCTVASGALLVMPRGLKRKEWKGALTPLAKRAGAAPDVLVIDATCRAQNADEAAVRRIPDFLIATSEKLGQTGALIITDDPATYFSLRYQLSKQGLQADSLAIAAEAEPGASFYSKSPKPGTWAPAHRAAVNFSVAILDRDAASLSLKFGRLADLVREEAPFLEDVFRSAQHFLMRVSHLPGGFVDLESADSEERDYLRRDLEWLRVEDPISEALRKGLLNDHRAQIELAVSKAKHLIDQCAKGTPLALKLLEQVRRFAIKTKEGLTILLSCRPDIAVAQRFLARTLGADWEVAKGRVEWMTFKDAWTALHARSDERRLVIVGMNRFVVRFALTHPEIPVGTQLLVPVQRAFSVEKTLLGMLSVDAFKPYKARIGALLAILKQRLAEVPNLEALTKS